VWESLHHGPPAITRSICSEDIGVIELLSGTAMMHKSFEHMSWMHGSWESHLFQGDVLTDILLKRTVCFVRRDEAVFPVMSRAYVTNTSFKKRQVELQAFVKPGIRRRVVVSI